MFKQRRSRIVLVGFRFGGGRLRRVGPQPKPLPEILFSGSCIEESCFTELLEDACAVLQSLHSCDCRYRFRHKSFFDCHYAFVKYVCYSRKTLKKLPRICIVQRKMRLAFFERVAATLTLIKPIQFNY